MTIKIPSSPKALSAEIKNAVNSMSDDSITLRAFLRQAHKINLISKLNYKSPNEYFVSITDDTNLHRSTLHREFLAAKIELRLKEASGVVATETLIRLGRYKNNIQPDIWNRACEGLPDEKNPTADDMDKYAKELGHSPKNRRSIKSNASDQNKNADSWSPEYALEKMALNKFNTSKYKLMLEALRAGGKFYRGVSRICNMVPHSEIVHLIELLEKRLGE